MKKLIGLILSAVVLTTLLTGCGGKAAKRQLYNNIKLSKYVTLGDYKGITVDTSSDDFKKFYDNEISADVKENDFYVHKTDGQVADGDTVNIDYSGTKDGVAFEGGTATAQDLEIGSDSFIDGFEDGLIGVNVGDTKELNLTFPEGYQSAELAGKAVVFTVKVNYIKTDEQIDPSEYYEKLEYKTLGDYKDNVTERAIKNYLVSSVKSDSKTKDYPQDDLDTLYNALKSQYDTMYQGQYGVTLEQMLSYSGKTEDDFKADMLKNNIQPMMDEQMVLYSVLDAQKLGLTDEDTSAQVSKMLKQYEGSTITEEQMKSYFGDYYFEYLAVSEKVKDYLYDNAKIK